jgi:hypothetical protein
MREESFSTSDILQIRQSRRLKRERGGETQHTYAVVVDVPDRLDMTDLPRVFLYEPQAECEVGWAVVEDGDDRVPVVRVEFDTPVEKVVMVGFPLRDRNRLIQELRYLARCSQFFLSFRPLNEVDIGENWEEWRDYGFWIPVAHEPLLKVIREPGG